MKMIDITTLNNFKIVPSIAVLQESNNALKLINESLNEKNDTLQKLVIISIIIIPVLSFVIYHNRQSKKQKP